MDNEADQPMAEYDKMMSDFYSVFETVRIPLVITDSNLVLVHANHFAKQVLPLRLEKDKRLEIDDFLQHEDSVSFERIVSECRKRGESGGTVKQREADKYFKLKVYKVKGSDCQMIFHFEDISHSRILEDQLYEHLVDLYGQLETQEKEITDLRAMLVRLREG